MLFNTFGFVFLYLPLVLAGYFAFARVGNRWAAAWLAAASLFFYGYWNVAYLPLLCVSILMNYGAARCMAMVGAGWRRPCLIAAVLLNLGLLAYFKYANFIIANLAGVLPPDWHGVNIMLPIGISFFTFTQIAFLVDCYQGKASEAALINYVLFVSYFPHLVAGPVLHHKEMMPQFSDSASYTPRAENFAVGWSVFIIGLAKKVLIADNLSPMVGPVFAADAHPALIEAWVGVLAYGFQLYFDFSGYSDMAIGLSRLFGIRLPQNFASPYQARNIAEFWRRWHMTLSRFLRDYLYIPLGGNRHGPWQRRRNLLVTMLLGGLWHGAGWTFVVWGGLHGAYLIVHEFWRGTALGRTLCERRWWQRCSLALTVGAVFLAWIFFRADTFAVAMEVLMGLAGGHGVALPHGWAGYASLCHGLGLACRFDGLASIDIGGAGLPALALAAALAFLAPNTRQLFARFDGPDTPHGGTARSWWSPKPAWGIAMASLFIACVLSMNRVSEFLYFQF